MQTSNLLQPRAPAQLCTWSPSLLHTGMAHGSPCDGEGHSSSWLSSFQGWTGFSSEHLSLWSYSVFRFGVVVPPAGRWAFEELNSVSWDWVSRRVKEHVRRSQCLLPSPQPAPWLPAHRGSLRRALAPPPLITALCHASAGPPEKPPVHHTANVLRCSPLPSGGLSHQSRPDSHHWDLPTLHRYTPSLLPEQYPRQIALKIRKAVNRGAVYFLRRM